MVVLTMGGGDDTSLALAPLEEVDGVVFVLCGRTPPVGRAEKERRSGGPQSIASVDHGRECREDGLGFFRRKNIRFLAKTSTFFHPDLVCAADLVVGKVGYSTLAEVYGAGGVPYAYVLRQQFREAPVLAEFVATRMPGGEVKEKALRDGSWLQDLERFFALGTERRPPENGALHAAQLLAELLPMT